MRRYIREPVNAITHGLGMLLAVVGLVSLLVEAGRRGWVASPWPLAVFGVSLVLLYLSSTLYHGLPVSARVRAHLRRVDHMMIYVLIAGTYTPVCLLMIGGRVGVGMCIAVWAVAAAGIVLKIGWMHAPRWLSVLSYVGMGCLAMVVLPQVLEALSVRLLVWLFLGGLFYLGGAIVYAMKRPTLIPDWFGFHEIWHLFVLAGSFSHFWLVRSYVIA